MVISEMMYVIVNQQTADFSMIIDPDGPFLRGIQ